MRRRQPHSLLPAYEESFPFQAPLPLTRTHASKNSYYSSFPPLHNTADKQHHPPPCFLFHVFSKDHLCKRGSSVRFHAFMSMQVTLKILQQILQLSGLLGGGGGIHDIFTSDPPQQFTQVHLFPSPCSQLMGENSYEACNWHQAGVISAPYAPSLPSILSTRPYILALWGGENDG